MDEYEAHWRDFKKRRNQLLMVFIGYVPLTAAFGLLTQKLFNTDKPFYVFGISWMLLALIATARYNTFPCPRCGEWFFSTWLYHNSFARRCVNCKLPLYGAKDDAAAQLTR